MRIFKEKTQLKNSFHFETDFTKLAKIRITSDLNETLSIFKSEGVSAIDQF